MSYLISSVFGQESVDRVPCDPESIESFTNEKFQNLRKEDILSFQENGVYFCFDRKGLREWVKRGNRTNPLTRQPLSADVLKKLGNLFPYDFVARIVYLNSFDGCEVSNLEVLNF